MPKRKNSKDSDSDEYILKKLRKLEKKIRRRRRSPTSSPTPLQEENDTPPMVIRCTPPPEQEIFEDTTQQDILQDAQQDKENILDEDIIQILGSNTLKNNEEMGHKIHDQIAERWENILQNGIEKSEKENILQQNYILPPSNCPHLVVPKMNPEALAACSEVTKKRDYNIEAKQKMLSHVIAGLACATEKVLVEVQPKQVQLNLLEILNNTGKILADVFHSENKNRRNMIVTGLEKDIRETLLQTKPDKYLFGENLSEIIKTAKAVGRTGQEMRLQHRPPNKNTSKGTQPLNWRGPPRQPQKQLYTEPRVIKNRSSGPRQTTTQRRGTAATRGYRRSNFNSQRHHKN